LTYGALENRLVLFELIENAELGLNAEDSIVSRTRLLADRFITDLLVLNFYPYFTHQCDEGLLFKYTFLLSFGLFFGATHTVIIALIISEFSLATSPKVVIGKSLYLAFILAMLLGSHFLFTFYGDVDHHYSLCILACGFLVLLVTMWLHSPAPMSIPKDEEDYDCDERDGD